jgi:hypothetical protein
MPLRTEIPDQRKGAVVEENELCRNALGSGYQSNGLGKPEQDDT